VASRGRSCAAAVDVGVSVCAVVAALELTGVSKSCLSFGTDKSARPATFRRDLDEDAFGSPPVLRVEAFTRLWP
jgi:hypothetical protein